MAVRRGGGSVAALLAVALASQRPGRRLEVAVVAQESVRAELVVGFFGLEGRRIAGEDVEQIDAACALAMPRGRAVPMILSWPAPAPLLTTAGDALPTMRTENLDPVWPAAVEVISRSITTAPC